MALAFADAPADAEAREPIEPPVRVEVVDENGDRVTDVGFEITVSLASDPTDGAVELSGTTTVATTDGVAEFADLLLGLPAEGYRLKASASPPLETATSTSFRVVLTFESVRLGIGHGCAATPDGVGYCWGYNAAGQLGDGTTRRRLEPVPVVQ